MESEKLHELIDKLDEMGSVWVVEEIMSTMFTYDQMRDAYMDGFTHGYHDKEDFDINNYR